MLLTLQFAGMTRSAKLVLRKCSYALILVSMLGAIPGAAEEFTSRTLTLADAIRMALESNVNFVISRDDVEIAGAGITVAEGAFAPHFVLDLHYAYDHSPGSVYYTEATDRQIALNADVEGRLRATGLEYKLEWNTFYESRDHVGVIYNPFQRTTFRIGATQPLLRNAWRTVNQAPIVVASLRRDESRSLMQAQIERSLGSVEIAYWALVLAIREREVREQTLVVERQQVEDTQKQVKLGAGSPIDILEGQAAVANTLDEIQALNQEMADAEGRLLALLQPHLDPHFTGVVPLDTPGIGPVAGTLVEHWATARRRRPDLIAARLELDATRVAEEVARNHLLPQVDLVANVGLTGFSGTLYDGYGTSGFGQPTPDPFPTQHTLPAFRPDASLEGGVGTMFANLRFLSGYVGVRIDAPLDNGYAVGQHHVEQARVKRQTATVAELERQIDFQVLTAYKRLLAEPERMRLTADAVKLAEGLLDGQRKRFRNGVAVAFDVLRASANVTRAKSAQLREQVSARISQVRLSIAEGTYVDERGIKIP